jgi:hypothetical protein
MIRCYNCGSLISRKYKTETKEHIPAQNLFEGFNEKYKINRIVVPSCLDCNNGSSIIDEEFRNLIGVASNYSYLNSISSNAAESMIKNGQFNRILVDEFGNIKGVRFNKELINKNHIKVFKGLFFHKYKKPISNEYQIISTIDPTNDTGKVLNYLESNFKWKFSGHPDVFSYILQPFRENLSGQEILEDLIPRNDENYFLSALKYNNTHAAIVYASLKSNFNDY